MSAASDHAYRTRFFNDLFREFHETIFALRSADGWSWCSAPGQPPQCTLVFKSAAAWRALIEDPTERSLGQAYIDGELDVEGDLFAVFPVVHYILDAPAGSHRHILRSLWHRSADFARLLRHGPRHSIARDRASISYHYDLPIDFYRPWLGPTLVYSCAYFRDSADTLESAQTNKLELICRKLGLRANETLLDIGCGWGSLLLHAGSRYGARAQGITLSQEQAVIAAQRIHHAHLDNQCKVERCDYREMTDLQFDKISSVGMFEHVGLKQMRNYFNIARRMLRPEGVFLNHGIARSATSPPSKDSFIDRYVFPDGELVTLGQVLETAEAAGFEVRDVDNLRSHYERTLHLWVENLERNARTVLNYASERTYRIWRLYMAGSADAFQRGNIELYQVLLGQRPARKSCIELREPWYQDWTTAASKAAVS